MICAGQGKNKNTYLAEVLSRGRCLSQPTSIVDCDAARLGRAQMAPERARVYHASEELCTTNRFHVVTASIR